MAIDYATLMAWSFPEKVHEYTQRDAMLYALGIGLGADPLSEDDLRFVYEEGLLALPTFASVIGYPGFWLKDPATGVDWRHVLNGEQSVVLHRPIPVEGRVVGRVRVDEIVDNGVGRSALIFTSRDLVEAETGELIGTIGNTIVARTNGGFGGTATRTMVTVSAPDRAPDHIRDTPISQRAGLIYRLSGDYNPLHADPKVARSAGYDRPILHGAATWGVAGYVMLQMFCDGDPNRFRKFSARFSSPVYPGNIIRTEAWLTGPGQASFRCRDIQRDKTVLDSGMLSFDVL